MRKRRLITGYLLGLALALAGVTSAAIAQTTAPKGNGKIAFVTFKWTGPTLERHGIWVMNPDGSDRRQLTEGRHEERHFGPAWSPDGTQIAYVKNFQVGIGRWDYSIWLMNADGSNQRRLTQPDAASWMRPAWSPDGARIAFMGVCRPGFYGCLYVMNADGGNQTVIGEGSSPSWSPDGSKLVVVTDDRLYILNADGSGRRQITAPQNPSPGLVDYDSSPAWSPDGTRISFNRLLDCDGRVGDCGSSSLLTVKPDGTGLTQITNNIWITDHNWSPDGAKIIFSSFGHNESDFFESDLFVMNADGSGITNITNSDGLNEFWPSWQHVALAPPGVNPIDNPDFFVRQQYRDFFGREPDTTGFANWMATLTGCPNGGYGEFDNPHCDRVHVSAGFVHSHEFQGRGYWILRFGYVGLNRSIGSVRSSATYAEFTPALAQVGGSNSPAQEEAAKVTYANAFVQRQDFLTLFPMTMTASQYVNALETNAQVTLPNKQALIDALNGGTMSRADVLRNVVESQVVFDKYLIPAFVTMEYFGYLRRDPDLIGYQNWVNTLTAEPNNYRHMIFGFIYSTEYRQRFGPA